MEIAVATLETKERVFGDKRPKNSVLSGLKETLFSEQVTEYLESFFFSARVLATSKALEQATGSTWGWAIVTSMAMGREPGPVGM